MKVAIIIPDRSDRRSFTAHCLKMIKAQTLQPSAIVHADWPAENDQADITYRYRAGYEILAGQGHDLIAFMENDDWYSPKYLRFMVDAWQRAGRPDMFGTRWTVYYHLKMRKYFRMYHDQRAAAMNTFIKPDLKIKWPLDHDPYTDSWLWMHESSEPRKKVLIDPEVILSIGMKHGVGKVGGHYHDTYAERFINEDNGFLQNTVDEQSFEFYNSITEELKLV